MPKTSLKEDSDEVVVRGIIHTLCIAQLHEDALLDACMRFVERFPEHKHRLQRLITDSCPPAVSTYINIVDPPLVMDYPNSDVALRYISVGVDTKLYHYTSFSDVSFSTTKRIPCSIHDL